jgi:pSer/pThr/pTyr-binding forkhead associated (FHA) protein
VDCPSCGATGQTKARCEACGFAFPKAGGEDVDDGALSLFLGLVCGTCDAYNDPGTSTCLSCGAALHVDGGGIDALEMPPLEPVSIPVAARVAPVVVPRAPTPLPTPAPSASSSAMSAPPSWMTPPTGSPLSTQFAMKKVDLAVVGGASSAGVLAGPVAPRAPGPLSAPPTIPAPNAPPVVAKPAPAPQAKGPPLAMPSSSSPEVREHCWRCNKELEPGDKFCRNCGARTDGGVGSAPVAPPPAAATAAGVAVTQMIATLKLPNPVAGPGAPGATMVLPALRGLGGVGPASPAAHGAGGPTATLMFGAATVERVAKLILVRGQSQFGSQWRLQAGETVIGRTTGMILFPDDNALAPRHARLVFRGPDLYLEPEPSVNGAFLRLREPARLVPGDEFVVGAQRLQLLPDADRPIALPATVDAATRLLGSMVKPNPPMAIARLGADQRFHEVYFRAQRLLTIGRVHCDVNFPVDGFVSERHAQLTNEGAHVTLEDLKSRNGTYVRVRQPTKLLHGDLLLLGDQVLRVELPQR